MGGRSKVCWKNSTFGPWENLLVVFSDPFNWDDFHIFFAEFSSWDLWWFHLCFVWFTTRGWNILRRLYFSKDSFTNHEFRMLLYYEYSSVNSIQHFTMNLRLIFCLAINNKNFCHSPGWLVVHVSSRGFSSRHLEVAALWGDQLGSSGSFDTVLQFGSFCEMPNRIGCVGWFKHDI